MKRLVCALALVVSSPGLAAELKAPSKIEGVVVFPSGAEVRRIAKLGIEAGEHEVVIGDLPEQAQPGSIRVEGRATGQLTIGAVDAARRVVPSQDPEVAASARRRLEDEIEATKDERSVIEAELKAAEARRNFIQNLVQLPGRAPVAANGQAAGREDWAQIAELIGRETETAQKRMLEAEIKVRAVDRRLRDLERRLKEERPRLETRTEVRIRVAAAAALEAEISVRYSVADAGWQPQYDARLATGSKAQAAKLTLTRRAAVSQNTSEAWQDVALSLSTTRPTAGTAAPELRTLTVDYVPDRPIPPPAPPTAMPRSLTVPGRTVGAAEEDLRKRVDGAAGADVAPAPVMEAAREQFAEAQVNAFQAVYEIPGRHAVANTGVSRALTIETSEIDPQLVVRSAPRVDPRAFLYAKIALPRTVPVLAGTVSLFRDGTFVGNGRLPQLAGGEEHELGFGADDRVRVRANVIEDKRGETGIIASSKTEQKSWRLTVRNLHERQIAISIQDQVPVSGNQDIKVELLGRPAPTARDIDGRRGVLAWDDKLNPDEEKAFEVGYRVTWPGAKAIRYGR